MCVCVCVCFGYNTTNNRVERRGTAGHYSTRVAKIMCVCVCVCACIHVDVWFGMCGCYTLVCAYLLLHMCVINRVPVCVGFLTYTL